MSRIIEIENELVKTSFRELIGDCTDSWRKEPFYEELRGILGHPNLEHMIGNVVQGLYDRLGEYLEEGFQTSSVRGRLRGFVPLGKEGAQAAAEEGTHLEVALNRVLALKNGWTTEFSTLSGRAGSSHDDKKGSIDLVAGDPSAKTGWLVELKSWKGSDHPFGAAVELIRNFICFILVREKDRNLDEGKYWPQWERFQLRVMAPRQYFKRWDRDSTESLLERIDRSLRGKFDQYVKSVHIGMQELDLEEKTFKEYMKRHQDLLAPCDGDPYLIKLH